MCSADPRARRLLGRPLERRAQRLTYLNPTGPGFGALAEGDVIKATAIASTITVYKNGQQVMQVDDAGRAQAAPARRRILYAPWMAQPPPPPRPAREQRRDPRVEVYASVELKRDDEILVLAVKNISLGGAYLLSERQDLAPQFAVGSAHELLIFDGSDESVPVARVTAEVLRHERDGGMAMRWTRNREAVAPLMERLKRR